MVEPSRSEEVADHASMERSSNHIDMSNRQVSRGFEPASSQQESFRFHDLPSELRHNIYRWLLVQSSLIHFYGRYRTIPVNAQLLRVSKQTYGEARTILYSKNEFATEVSVSGKWSTLHAIAEENLGLIRRLHVNTSLGTWISAELAPMTFSGYTGPRFDAKIVLRMTSLEKITLLLTTGFIMFDQASFPSQNSRLSLVASDSTVPICCSSHREINKRTKRQCRSAARLLMQNVEQLDKIMEATNYEEIEIR